MSSDDRNTSVVVEKVQGDRRQKEEDRRKEEGGSKAEVFENGQLYLHRQNLRGAESEPLE
jgi:hypothetical protein